MPRDIKLMTLSLFLWGWGYGLYAYVFPLHIRSLGALPGEVGAVFSIMLIALAVSYVPGGIIADRCERKRTILLSWLIGVPAPLLYYFAADYKVIAAGAALYSLSMVGYPAMNAYAAQKAPAGMSGLAFGVINSGYAAGMIVGPVLGGWLAEIVGTRNVFLISFAFFAVAVAVLCLIGSQSPGCAACESHARNNATPGRSTQGYAGLLRQGRFRRFVATYSCMAIAYYMIQPLVSQYLGDEMGASLSFIGLTGSIMSLGQATITLVLGRCADKWGTAVALGGNGFVFSVAVLGLVTVRSIALLAVVVFLAGAFMAGQGVALAGVGEALGGSATGRAFGLFNLAVAASSIVGPYAGGILYERSSTAPFLASAGASALLSLVLLLGGRRSCHNKESGEVVHPGAPALSDGSPLTNSYLGGTRDA
ncbi:MAG: MFS transporter [Firmicutes bacterium]|jgi:MFS family permease|nr:MFS transporter [Bacillota bacterium]MDH7495290.1 MFS transporter [Bacillota bacterium]